MPEPTTRHLPPCPRTPNCVSTTSTDPGHRMEPLPFRALPEARERLLAVLAAQPGAKVVAADELYVRAEFRTRLLRFVDDVEFLFDPGAGLLHFRSASRLGRSDFGTNRRRMEGVRKAFLAAAPD